MSLASLFKAAFFGLLMSGALCSALFLAALEILPGHLLTMLCASIIGNAYFAFRYFLLTN